MEAPSSQEQSAEAGDQTNVNNGKWTTAEHTAFLASLEKHGCDWGNIAEDVRTRTPSQVRSHAQKYFNKQANDQERIGYNRALIIGAESESTRTRSRLAEPKITAHHAKDSHSHQPRKDLSACKGASKKKPIEKERRKVERKHEVSRCSEAEQAKPSAQFVIVLPSSGEGKLSGGKAQLVGRVEMEPEERYWIQTIVMRLKEPGLDLRGMHQINTCGFQGAFKRVIAHIG